MFLVGVNFSLFARGRLTDLPVHSIQLGFSPEAKVEGAKFKERTKEKEGFVAGKHIHKESRWWFQRSKKDWTA